MPEGATNNTINHRPGNADRAVLSTRPGGAFYPWVPVQDTNSGTATSIVWQLSTVVIVLIIPNTTVAHCWKHVSFKKQGAFDLQNKSSWNGHESAILF